MGFYESELGKFLQTEEIKALLEKLQSRYGIEYLTVEAATHKHDMTKPGPFSVFLGSAILFALTVGYLAWKRYQEKKVVREELREVIGDKSGKGCGQEDLEQGNASGGNASGVEDEDVGDSGPEEGDTNVHRSRTKNSRTQKQGGLTQKNGPGGLTQKFKSSAIAKQQAYLPTCFNQDGKNRYRQVAAKTDYFGCGILYSWKCILFLIQFLVWSTGYVMMMRQDEAHMLKFAVLPKWESNNVR
jgi:hypothetical protein